MKITSVEPQKRILRLRSGQTTRRFNIFLDGVFGFGADEDTVVKFRLVPGKVIEPAELDKILFETEVGKLMGRIYNLFSVRQRSEKEVRDKLRIKNYELRIKGKEEYSELVIEKLIQNLKQKGMLDDERFAREWVESRRRSKQKGDKVLMLELRQKGVDRDIIVQVLEESEDEETQEKLAKEALGKKARVWKNLEKQEFKKKATEFLVRRGFSYSTAKDVVENFISEEYNSS